MSLNSDFSQPGVSFHQQIINISQREKLTALPVFIGYADHPDAPVLERVQVTSLQDYYDQFGRDAVRNGGYLADAMRLYFSHGGGQCYVISLGTLIEDVPSVAGYDEALALLADEPDITLVVLPELPLLDENQWESVVNQLAICCATSLNLTGLIDYPGTPADAEKYNAKWGNEHWAHLAGYWPWVMVSEDPAFPTRALRAVPPSAAVAAKMQQSDKQRGIWYAPANLRLERVLKPQYDHLTPVTLFHPDPRTGRSVNQIRSFPGRGVKIWGCRTLSKQPDLRFVYLQNQRLVKWIKQTLKEAMRPYVFEPNNEITWYRLHAVVRQQLKRLWEQGGLAGGVEDDAYKISVGLDETMSASEIASGLLRVRVAVATQRPAEFIHINLDFYLTAGHVAATGG